MTILASTDNKLAYNMLGMFTELIVRFVNSLVALTIIFQSYWIFNISINIYDNFFSLTAND